MHHRFYLKTSNLDNGSSFYAVNRLTDQALVERLPANPYVELYENRLGISFEIDPSTTNV
jgi:hypothetical protein